MIFIAVGVGDRIELVRGARLAGALEADDIEILRRTAALAEHVLVEHGLEHPHHPSGGLLREHAMLGAFRAIRDVALTIAHFLDDARLAVHAAIADRGQGARELERGDGHAVAERDVREIDVAPVLAVAEHAEALAGELDARARAEPEKLEPVVQPLRAEEQRDLRGADVRRSLDDAGGRQVRIEGVIGDRAPSDDNAAADLEFGVGLDHAVLERRGDREDLHHRACLECIGDR